MFTFLWRLLRRLILRIVCLFTRPPVPPTGPWSGDAAIGRWDVVLTDSHVSAIHMAVLRTKEVIWFSGGRGILPSNPGYDPAEIKTWVWKVADIGATGPINPPTETGPVTSQMFCAGHSFLRDGRLLVVGGSWPDGTGIRDVNIYDPDTKSWTPVDLLGRKRWYPTTVTLPDGRIAAFSGRGDRTVQRSTSWGNLGKTSTWIARCPSIRDSTCYPMEDCSTREPSGETRGVFRTPTQRFSRRPTPTGHRAPLTLQAEPGSQSPGPPAPALTTRSVRKGCRCSCLPPRTVE